MEKILKKLTLVELQELKTKLSARLLVNQKELEKINIQIIVIDNLITLKTKNG